MNDSPFGWKSGETEVMIEHVFLEICVAEKVERDK